MGSNNFNSFGARTELTVGARTYTCYSLETASQAGLGDLSRLPFSSKIILENMLRHEDGISVSREDMEAVVQSAADGRSEKEIAFRPARSWRPADTVRTGVGRALRYAVAAA